MNAREMLNIANPIQGTADLTGYTANQLNREQFKEQMNFSKYQFETQKEMANSAHQREVADLKAAGLNPVLSATGGNGAGNVSSVGMPEIPDNSATQKGMGSILNAIMTIAPQIAELKNASSAMKTADAQSKVANAQSIKLLAEAGKIGTEKDINNFVKLMKKYEWEHYGDIIETNISKSPYWMLNKLKEMFDMGTNSAFSKDFENLGKGLFRPLQTITNNNPAQKGINLIMTLLSLL